MARPANVVLIGDAAEADEAILRRELAELFPDHELIKISSIAAYLDSGLIPEGQFIAMLCFNFSQLKSDPRLSEFKQELLEQPKRAFQTVAIDVEPSETQSVFKLGADFVIESHADKAHCANIIHSALLTAKTKRRLFSEVKEASDIALLAMETSSFLGEVIKFLESSFACKTLEDLFDTIELCISRMNLSCCAVMDSDGSQRYFSNKENHHQLEFMLASRNDNRIWDNKDMTLFSFPYLSVMVYPMPVNEHDRYGQLKDVLVMLANGANARVHGINIEHLAMKAYETKSAFLAKMSHELRTPLNAIIGFSRLMQRKKLTDTYSQRDLDAVSAINSNGHHLLSMVTDLLDFAQLDVGGLSLAKSHCDVVPIVSKVVEGYRFWADEKKIDLYPVTSENGLIAVVDPARLEQAIRNVISNAIKYTEQGCVRAHVQRTVDARLGDCFAICVQDTGVGISDESYKQLVQIFTRPNLAAVRSLDGVGMGLSMAAALVDLHQGMISLDRLPEGGSLFTITIPLNPAVNQAAAAAETVMTNSDIELF